MNDYGKIKRYFDNNNYAGVLALMAKVKNPENLPVDNLFCAVMAAVSIGDLGKAEKYFKIIAQKDDLSFEELIRANIYAGIPVLADVGVIVENRLIGQCHSVIDFFTVAEAYEEMSGHLIKFYDTEGSVDSLFEFIQDIRDVWLWRVVRTEAKNIKDLIAKAETHLELGDDEGADEYVKRALAMKPKAVELLDIGYVLDGLEQGEQAVRVFKEALDSGELEDDGIRCAAESIVMILEENGLHRQAAGMRKELLAKYPESSLFIDQEEEQTSDNPLESGKLIKFPAR